MNRRNFITAGCSLAIAPLLDSTFSYGKSLKPIRYSLGCAAITWGDEVTKAIDDVLSLGFKGIQLRANCLKLFGENPSVLRKMLQDSKLSLPMFSGGNINIDTGDDEAQYKKLEEVADFIASIGGKWMQVTNNSRPKTGNPTREQLVQYAKMLNELANRVESKGIRIAYHNHMHQLGETPEEVDTILQNTNPEKVSLLLDIAHYYQGGGNPSKAIVQYKDRLICLHIKDVEKTSDDTRFGFQFVELGKGSMPLETVFEALEKIDYKHWAIVELDSIPKGRIDAKTCAATSYNYLVKNKLVQP